jgi:hypothetical protein
LLYYLAYSAFFHYKKTPPKVSDEKIKIGDIIGLDALKLLKIKTSLSFVLSIFNLSLAFLLSKCNLFLIAGVEKSYRKNGHWSNI